jgi:FAD/FMN-containing dehydrogenase
MSKLYNLPLIALQCEVNESRASSGMESVCVDFGNISELLGSIANFFEKYNVNYYAWWDLMTGELRVFPYLDLRKMGHRQKYTAMLDEYYKIVMSAGGTVSHSGGGGRTSSNYLRENIGDVEYEIMKKIKAIFDPYNILNPGVKIESDKKYIETHLVQTSSLGDINNRLY